MGEMVHADIVAVDCQACGACCAYSRDWPRFWTESDAEIERIPRRYRDETSAAMRCDGNRCSALEGEIGRSTRCMVYADRPVVCRDCVPGDDACRIARAAVGLAA
jgi:Fe-S-cluster containining protein